MVAITCNAVGDIIAVASFILDIARALNDIRGSAFQYRSFTEELHGLHTMLTIAARIAVNCADKALSDEIVRKVDQCGRDVQRAFERIAQFSVLGEDHVTGEASRIKLKRQWIKVKWHFTQHEDTQTAREELAMATQRLTALLVLSNTDGAARFRTQLLSQLEVLVARDSTLSHVVKSETAVRARLPIASRTRRDDPALVQHLFDHVPHWVDSRTATVAVLCAAVCAMHGPYDHLVPTALLLVAICILLRSPESRTLTLPQDVAYPTGNTITLLDALGRRLTLPYELCGSYDVFHATLVNLFSCTEGRWFVDAHKYDLSSGSACVDAAGWGSLVHPGVEIEMAIIVERVVFNLARLGITCPVCHFDNVGDTYRAQATCMNCHRALSVAVFLPEVLPPGHQSAADSSKSIAVRDRGFLPARSRPAALPASSGLRPASACRGALRHPDSANLTYGTEQPTTMVWATQIKEFRRFRTHIRSSESLSYSNLSLTFTGPAPDRHVLLAAAENGHYKVASGILDAGLDVNSCDVSGFTALHLACWNGHARVAELLLQRGASVDAATLDDVTPFACALMSMQPDVLDLLLDHKAIVNASEALQAVALHIAIIMSNADVAQMLVGLGIDINRPLCKIFSATPLDTAVRQVNYQLVEMLLQHNADVNVRSNAGLTPLELAAQSGQEDIFELLFAVQISVSHDLSSVMDGTLHYAILGGNSRVLEIMLETGIDARKRLSGGMSPLSMASELGHVQQVQLLLAHGSDANADALPSPHTSLYGHRWEHEWTPLHAAAYTGRAAGVEIVELLIQHGADVNASTTIGGYTPLSLLLERKRNAMVWPFMFHDEEIIEVLLSWGAMLDERSCGLLRELGSPLCEDGMDGVMVPGAWSDD
ncbi:unnamed protein product [Peniophora sp. CBMAI 1063]|nr:unnamed protein product [Peniophora sp. CBMAI 1063]